MRFCSSHVKVHFRLDDALAKTRDQIAGEQAFVDNLNRLDSSLNELESKMQSAESASDPRSGLCDIEVVFHNCALLSVI